MQGRYTELSWTRLALLAGAVGYVASPVDVLPELVLVIPGLLDDTVVAAWAAGALLDETERFIKWERRHDSQEVRGMASYPTLKPRP